MGNYMRVINKVKGKLFRKVINIADTVDIWFKGRYNVNPKQKALEFTQDLIPMKQLDKTIGKSLDII